MIVSGNRETERFSALSLSSSLYIYERDRKALHVGSCVEGSEGGGDRGEISDVWITIIRFRSSSSLKKFRGRPVLPTTLSN